MDSGAVKNNGSRVLRYFQLKLKNKKLKQLFDRFQKKVIIGGGDVTQRIMQLISDEDDRMQIYFTPLYEADMLELMIKKGVSRTRQSLKRMRDRGELVDPDTDEQLWGTDGSSIVYNSEAVIKLLKSRGKGRQSA